MVVDSVNRLRSASDVTVNDLAGRLAGVGWPVSQATLSGILSGHKRGSISVTEILAFARALEVPPVYLMIGLPNRASVPESPIFATGSTDVGSVAGWITGRTRTPSTPALRRVFSQNAVENVVAYAVAWERVRWQAAQILALNALPSNIREHEVFERIRSQEYLRISLRFLASTIAEEKLAEESWRVPFAPLPPFLRRLEELTYEQTAVTDFSFPELTNEQLRLLVTDAEIDEARVSLLESVRVVDAMKKEDAPWPDHEPR